MFGHAIGSYFLFVRWVFLMNLFIGLLWVFFVIVPQSLGAANTLDASATYNSSIARSLVGEIIAGTGGW